MTDFKRLIDEVDSDLARAVLSSGRVSTGNGARKAQVLTALGVGLVIGTTNKISMAALSTWQKMMFIGGVACVGAGGAMTYTYIAAPSFAAPSHIAAPSFAAPSHIAVSAPQQPATEQPTPLEGVAPARVEAPSLRGAPSDSEAKAGAKQEPAATSLTSASTTRGVARESSMKAELGLLEQARTSLNGGSPQGALQVLARYGERYPRGSMRLEAQVLKVEALAASGRTQEAARLADRLLLRNPKSVVASRLRRFASKD